jgi:hypothetical protein
LSFSSAQEMMRIGLFQRRFAALRKAQTNLLSMHCIRIMTSTGATTSAFFNISDIARTTLGYSLSAL